MPATVSIMIRLVLLPGLTQRSEKGKTVCTIYPRTGSFDGMPQARAYRLELLAREKAPSKVTLGDGTATDYEYDAAGKKVIVFDTRELHVTGNW